MDAEEPFPFRYPDQVGARRKRPLDQPEALSKKREAFGERSATKLPSSTQPVANSAKLGGILSKGANGLAPPRKPTKMVSQPPEGHKSVPRMKELYPELGKLIPDRRKKFTSQPSQAPQSYRTIPKAPERNMAQTSMRDRILQNAQETLMKMIDEGDTEQAIANQVNIVEKLRSRTKLGVSLKTTAGPATVSKTVGKEDRNKRPLQMTKERSQTATRGLFISDVDTTDVVTITSSPEPQLEYDSESSSDSPVNERRNRRSKASKKSRKGARDPYVAATLQTAFPASKPTSLPYGVRTKRNLSPNEILIESRVHSSFDKTKTNQIDRHIRKINTTNGTAKEKETAARNMQERIGFVGLTDSDTDLPQAKDQRSNRGNEKDGDLHASRDASDKDNFVDFDRRDEEADLLSDDGSMFQEGSPSEQLQIPR